MDHEDSEEAEDDLEDAGIPDEDEKEDTEE